MPSRRSEASIERWFTGYVQDLQRDGWNVLEMKMGKHGWPDRVLLVGGRVLFIELKTIGGRVSKLQKDTHEMIRSVGFSVITPYTKDELRELVDAFLEAS